MKLYKKDNTGKIRVWETLNTFGGFVIEHGIIDGVKQVKSVPIVPKANRTFDEQRQLEIRSRERKQMEKGYVRDIANIDNSQSNSMGLYRPMLAKVYDPKRHRGNEYYVQPKFNGHRCLIHKNICGDVIAYSRGGKLIESINHILEPLKGAMRVGDTLDGELYRHGMPLQQIGSYVRKKQPASYLLSYMLYDIVENDCFAERHKEYMHRFNSIPCTTVVEAKLVKREDLVEQHSVIKNLGYEGLILRTDDKGYEDGKRSSSLLKLKSFIDAEYEILDVIKSRDGKTVLVLDNPEGPDFKVTAPGTYEQNLDTYCDKELFLGTYIKIKYFELTKDNVPFHPIALEYMGE